MSKPPLPPSTEDERTLAKLGYAQELHRGMGAFSNFALSLSIICILAGGVTSFHLGLCAAGGASIGLGWPFACLFSLVVALTMAQVASAFPTAGGLYHWSALLGGRGWGWATAWFNLAGLVTVLAAINVGAYEFTAAALFKHLGFDPEGQGAWKTVAQTAFVLAFTLSQALVNHRGIRLTTRLTDFSGYWILVVAGLLTLACLVFAPSWDLGRLVRFDNFGGLPAGEAVWPAGKGVFELFLLGLLLPGYTITGFDASAHAAEETVDAARRAPRGIVRSVLVSGLFGWAMLCAVVLAAPDLRAAAGQGGGAFVWIIEQALPAWLALPLFVAVLAAQYLCGLATVTSASRVLFSFSRDGGTPFSATFRRVHPTFRTPVAAVWAVALASVAFTVYTPVYSTITAVCVLFLYLSYVLPTALGALAYGRTWTRMGPWDLGGWYRPLAAVCVAGCAGLFVIGVQPPNEKALPVVAGFAAALAVGWLAWARRRFPGPPTAPLAGPERD
jgi:amino acid transporter